MRADTLLDEAVAWVRRHRVDQGESGVEVDADTDLLEHGILDSLGYVRLLEFLTERCGAAADLADLDADDLATVARLCRVFLAARASSDLASPGVA